MADEHTGTAEASRVFDKELYELGAIEDALEIYAPFGTLSMDRDAHAWTVRFDDVDEDLDAEILASEFANFVLVATIERAR
ncbi:MAG: HxsD-like protein [Myxococcota bacterium]